MQQWAIEKLGLAPSLKEADRVKIMEELHKTDYHDSLWEDKVRG